MRVSQKINHVGERVKSQGAQFRERCAQSDLERQGQLLEKLSDRRKALNKIEMEKRKTSMRLEERNVLKLDIGKKTVDNRKEEVQ